MKRFIKWCIWEMNNELIACTYFAVMLIMYAIIDLILGKNTINIAIIFEMYLVNYLLSIVQKIILDTQKDYSRRSFLLRAIIINILSVILVVIVSTLGGWYQGMPLWAGILIIAMLLLSYLTVWIIVSLSKKYDTKLLNDQLSNFKRKQQLKWMRWGYGTCNRNKGFN